MNNSIPERFTFQCALLRNLERKVFMTHGYADSHIIDQALRSRLKDETSVTLSDLYLQILQYIETNNTTLTDIIADDREPVLSQNLSKVLE